MRHPNLLPWTHRDITAFGTAPHRAPHRLHESPAFGDEALAALLDRLPREVVHPYTMGEDPADSSQWRRGAPTDLPGATLLEVVARGRLWLNLVGVNRHDPQLRETRHRASTTRSVPWSRASTRWRSRPPC
ncbi:hypothetical protein G5V59_17165 [Nocardioides sp. W3-2-3]|uniref:hypothetical protein n=1 Tax=Nocardioides convexus TaxID=2712224 RepID=UPI0024189D36|nr:hypothetical protein [Nocardioides convexus]NHA01026.1 hypothetical protein [Nocardioides convexus]